MQILEEIHGKKLILDDPRNGVYGKLVPYFTGFADKCKALGIDPEKGILLIGPVGCGKTSVMKILRQNMVNDFRVKECREIVLDFDIHGSKSLIQYMKGSFSTDIENRKPVHFCFDDLGLEDTNVNRYGNKSNVMADILLSRYNLWESHGMITHATTNCSLERLEELYGDRLMSRILKMMTPISFGDASDLRKL